MIFVFGRICVPPVWLSQINKGLEKSGYTYKMYSMYRPNKNFLLLTLLKDNEEKVVKINYRENFVFTWEEFLDKILETLDQ